MLYVRLPPLYVFYVWKSPLWLLGYFSQCHKRDGAKGVPGVLGKPGSWFGIGKVTFLMLEIVGSAEGASLSRDRKQQRQVALGKKLVVE